MRRAPKAFRLHIGLFGRRNAGKSSLLNAMTRQNVSIVSDVAGTTTVVAEQPLSEGNVLLSLESFEDRYELSATPEGGARLALGSAPTAPLSSECAGGFTGVYFGMLAFSESGPTMPPADFDFFEYEAQ